MNLSAQEINAQLLMLPEQEQLKVFYFLRNQLQSLMAKELSQESDKNNFAVFSGVLKDSPHFNDDPVEIQRRMRDDWR